MLKMTWMVPLFGLGVGCTDYWQAGTWLESDFNYNGDACSWADPIVAPEKPHQYTLGDPTEVIESDDANDVFYDDVSLSRKLESLEGRSENLWTVCSPSSPMPSNSIQFDCPIPIHDAIELGTGRSLDRNLRKGKGCSVRRP